MTDSCRIFDTEYKHQFTKKTQAQQRLYVQSDCFAERIEDGQIDPHLASLPTKFDEAAEKLVYNQLQDNTKTCYQITFKDPWSPRGDGEIEKSSKDKRSKEDGFQSELFAYIRKLYFHPHDEKVLAPPVTGKRVFGYSSPKDLHGTLSMYQHIHGRTGGLIMLKNATLTETVKERESLRSERSKGALKEVDCTEFKDS